MSKISQIKEDSRELHYRQSFDCLRARFFQISSENLFLFLPVKNGTATFKRIFINREWAVLRLNWIVVQIFKCIVYVRAPFYGTPCLI